MRVNLRNRTKVNLGTITPGRTFRLIDKVQCFMVIDLAKEDIFAALPPTMQEVELAILRNDVVYVSDLATGIVQVLPKTLPVYEVQLKNEEVDLEKK